jgi:iron complex outermembrane receptor protein
VVFKVSEQFSLYASYMEGLSQGNRAVDLDQPDQIFAPFISRQVEVGASTTWAPSV